MADAVVPLQRLSVDRVDKARKFPGAAAYLDDAVAHQRDACRVITAILEPSKAVEKNRNDWFGT
jgi:hypothetical protein